MLFDVDRNWIVVLPAKCGVRRLINAVHRSKREDIIEYRVHDGFLPTHATAKYTSAKQFLQVRDPLERYVSMYWYIKNASKRHYINDGLYDEYMKDFSAFLDRAYRVNLWLQSRGAMERGFTQQVFWPLIGLYLDNLPNAEIIQIEKPEDVQRMMERMGLPYRLYNSVSVHSNDDRNTTENTLENSEQLSPNARRMLASEYTNLARRGCRYEIPGCLHTYSRNDSVKGTQTL